MDDFQVVIYILVIVIFIASRVLRARKKSALPPTPKSFNIPKFNPESSEDKSQPVTLPSQPKPITFEDLIKEFAGYEEKPGEAPPVKQVIQEVHFPEKKEIRREQTKVNLPGHSSGAEYTSFKSYSQDEGTMVAPNYSPFQDIPAPDDGEKDRFIPYSTPNDFDIHKASRFRRLLSSTITARDAIIMKEILDRKTF